MWYYLQLIFIRNQIRHPFWPLYWLRYYLQLIFIRNQLLHPLWPLFWTGYYYYLQLLFPIEGDKLPILIDSAGLVSDSPALVSDSSALVYDSAVVANPGVLVYESRFLVFDSRGLVSDSFGFRLTGFSFRLTGFGLRFSGFSFRLTGFSVRLIAWPFSMSCGLWGISHSKFQDWESSEHWGFWKQLMDSWPWLTAFGRYPPMPHYYPSHGHVCGGSVGGMLEKVAKPCAVHDPYYSKIICFQEGFDWKMHGPKQRIFVFFWVPQSWAFGLSALIPSVAVSPRPNVHYTYAPHPHYPGYYMSASKSGFGRVLL